MKKLIDSGKLGWAESKHPSFTSFSADGERINQLTPTILFLRKIHEGVEHFEHFEPNRCRLESLPATKNHRGVLWDSENESDAWICSVPDFETRLQSPPRNPLELMPRQQQQGNADKVLVANNFDRDVTAIKGFRSIFTTAMCKRTIKTLLDDSNLNAFQTLWLRSNILFLVDVP